MQSGRLKRQEQEFIQHCRNVQAQIDGFEAQKKRKSNSFDKPNTETAPEGSGSAIGGNEQANGAAGDKQSEALDTNNK